MVLWKRTEFLHDLLISKSTLPNFLTTEDSCAGNFQVFCNGSDWYVPCGARLLQAHNGTHTRHCTVATD